jgi:DNA-binding transcriptional regulator YdaS (Cro superfamily)
MPTLRSSNMIDPSKEAYARDRKTIIELLLPYAVKTAIKEAGGLRELARRLDINHQAILQWEQIPVGRLLEIERVTGVPRELLRPDLYRAEQLGDAFEQWANY